jgi:hypothetical protein
VDPVCSFSTDWSPTIFMIAVTGMCGVWAWKSLALQIAHALEQRRALEEQYDHQRTTKYLSVMRDLAVAKSRETLRGYEKQRHIDEAACYQEAIQRLNGFDPSELKAKAREAA